MQVKVCPIKFKFIFFHLLVTRGMSRLRLGKKFFFWDSALFNFLFLFLNFLKLQSKCQSIETEIPM